MGIHRETVRPRKTPVWCMTNENIYNSLSSLNFINIVWHKKVERENEWIAWKLLELHCIESMMMTQFYHRFSYSNTGIQTWQYKWFIDSNFHTLLWHNNCYCDITTLCGLVFNLQFLLEQKMISTWLTAFVNASMVNNEFNDFVAHL